MNNSCYVELTIKDGSVVIDKFTANDPINALTQIAMQAETTMGFDYVWATCYLTLGDVKQWELSIK